ncbi:unnamed protein product [marine sediment metagenome]|uniref:DNA topoisomerase type IA zn finger domain-containing protein n=1 Tax=marine sediment metagenome TaxID=412755 RepID=X1C954_9ZZZZ
MAIKKVLTRFCPSCGIEMIPPEGQGHRWTCPRSPKICKLIDSTFNEFTGFPRKPRYAATPLIHYKKGVI